MFTEREQLIALCQLIIEDEDKKLVSDSAAHLLLENMLTIVRASCQVRYTSEQFKQMFDIEDG